MNNDGRVLIELSPDNMVAKATFTPPLSDGRHLSQEDVDYELRAAGVVDGILWEIIRESLDECNDNAHIVRSIVIAKGIHARPAMPEAFVFPPKIQALDSVFLPPELQEQNLALSSYFIPAHAKKTISPQAKAVGAIDAHGNIDFRESHGVFIINEGQVLAAKRPAIEGIPGRTIRGEYVPFLTLSVNEFNPGMNTEMRDGRIYASKNGRLLWNSSSFWVEENMELAIDVGYKTGNIRFPGNLLLKAGIKDRFKVWVGGNLEANGVIDAFEVFCGGNLHAKAGIIGHGEGLVRCKGNLNARFIENARIECLGDIIIENTALHAHLFSESMIKTGEKGKLVGGEIHALKGVEVQNLGNVAGTHTEIIIGEDYVEHRKLDYARNRFQELQSLVRQLDEKLNAILQGAGKSDLPEHVREQRLKLQEEAQKYQAMMGDVAQEIHDDFLAVLKVRGTCFPGVRITICSASLEITKDQKNVQFSLDADHKKIIVTSLNPAKK
jgi:uncharacterized protein (DUF342 family)